MKLKLHLTRFYVRVVRDRRLRRPHLSLYLALLVQGCDAPFRVKRKEVMLCARIGSRVTYHRCMLELAEWGYIRYVPSYDPGSKSEVRIMSLAGDIAVT